ncbi:MAG: hypothetical protein WCR72_12520 [Bacteroidota bacterium]
MIKQVLFNASYILILLISFSCASGQKHKNQELKTGEIYPSVTCQGDTSLTYALQLPTQYVKDKSYPVLILFDSHGDGLLPVNLFSAEALKNDFIIAGSNNSKNGMPVAQTTAIYRALLADLAARFNIEKQAIYLCGFSGGSRVAGAAAITEGGVAGVVGCGAGLPNTNQKPVSRFSYLAVVGNQDFNYTEMLQLDESLEQAGFQHHLLVFGGIHQWPPKDLIPDIFTWLLFDAMRQKAIPADRKQIDQFIEKCDKTANAYAADGKFHEQQDTYLKMAHFLQGLTDVAPLQTEINRLSGEKEVISFRAKQKQIQSLEQELQRKYSPEIQQRDIAWWTKETTKLINISTTPGDPDINQVYKRLLGFLSLNCYMYSSGALKQGDIAAAAKFIEIYRLVDPTNAEHRYMAAEVAALSKDPDAMLLDLKQAFELGFKDIKRLQADPDFIPYHQDARYKSLLQGKQ